MPDTGHAAHPTVDDVPPLTPSRPARVRPGRRARVTTTGSGRRGGGQDDRRTRRRRMPGRGRRGHQGARRGHPAAPHRPGRRAGVVRRRARPQRVGQDHPPAPRRRAARPDRGHRDDRRRPGRRAAPLHPRERGGADRAPGGLPRPHSGRPPHARRRDLGPGGSQLRAAGAGRARHLRPRRDGRALPPRAVVGAGTALPAGAHLVPARAAADPRRAGAEARHRATRHGRRAGAGPVRRRYDGADGLPRPGAHGIRRRPGGRRRRSGMTAAEQRAEDRARLQDVTHVLHGEHGTGAVQRVLYAVYLLGLLAFTYGFTVARALFITSDPAWLHDRLLGPGAAVVAVLLAVALTALVHGLGRRRGPVVPPLPWVDHVVSGPLDRAATLREWWLVSATLLVAGATVLAGVIGGGLWASGTTGPMSLVVALVVGLGLGVVVAAAWLAGQVGAGGSGADALPSTHGAGRGRGIRLLGPSAALRRLGLTTLRAQSIR